MLYECAILHTVLTLSLKLRNLSTKSVWDGFTVKCCPQPRRTRNDATMSDNDQKIPVGTNSYYRRLSRALEMYARRGTSRRDEPVIVASRFADISLHIDHRELKITETFDHCCPHKNIGPIKNTYADTGTDQDTVHDRGNKDHQNEIYSEEAP